MATIKRTETSNVTWKEVLEIINSGNALLKRFEIHSPVPDAVIALESGSVPATRKITLQLTELNASFWEISFNPTASAAKVVDTRYTGTILVAVATTIRITFARKINAASFS